MTKELKPDILQMLEIGRECGLIYFEEAYHNYLNHYDCFFLIERLQEQMTEFKDELLKAQLLEADEEGTLYLKSMSIENAIKQVKLINIAEGILQ